MQKHLCGKANSSHLEVGLDQAAIESQWPSVAALLGFRLKQPLSHPVQNGN
jgi:hypothetical protein